MPIFDIECPCGVTYPAITTIKDGTSCPKCGNKDGRRLIGAPADRIYTTFKPGNERYQKWFHSEKTQESLKSGENVIASKSDDVNHY